MATCASLTENQPRACDIKSSNLGRSRKGLLISAASTSSPSFECRRCPGTSCSNSSFHPSSKHDVGTLLVPVLMMWRELLLVRRPTRMALLFLVDVLERIHGVPPTNHGQTSRRRSPHFFFRLVLVADVPEHTVHLFDAVAHTMLEILALSLRVEHGQGTHQNEGLQCSRGHSSTLLCRSRCCFFRYPNCSWMICSWNLTLESFVWSFVVCFTWLAALLFCLLSLLFRKLDYASFLRSILS